MSKTTRVVAIGDLHCGHVAGLTPPEWQDSPAGGDKPRRGRARFAKQQEQLYAFYRAAIDALQPIDALFVLGDCIEGKGPKTGGTELLTADRNEQADMAAACIHATKAKKIVMVYGTPYHTGDGEDLEDIVADKVGAEKIGAHEWVKVGGQVFDLKHHIGSSHIPHGRHTAVSREVVWNALWAERGESPRGTIFLRAHVHYFNYCGGANWLGMTLPALQGKGSKYGARLCSGLVDFGLVAFSIDSDGGFTWSERKYIAKLAWQPARALTL